MSPARPFLLPAGIFLLALMGCAQDRSTGSVGRFISGGNIPENRVDPAVLEACRQRANEVFDRQNRSAIFSPASNVNSPLSANSSPTVDRGLSAQFSYQQMLQECIRSAGVARDMPASTTPTTPSSSGAGATGTMPGAKAPPPPSAR